MNMGQVTENGFQSGISLCLTFHRNEMELFTYLNGVVFQSGISLCLTFHNGGSGDKDRGEGVLFQSGISLCLTFHSLSWPRCPLRTIRQSCFNQASACV